MDYEFGKWLERIETKLDFIIEKSGFLKEEKQEKQEEKPVPINK